MRVETKNSHVHRKRHGNHQKRTGKFLKVYTPYLPLTLLIAASIFMGMHPAKSSSAPAKPKSPDTQSVLAYATDIGVSGLLGSTNQQRSANGKSALTINGKLNNAAQAKANDMANRNYWSHNTPDGSPPWVFITNAGYSYSAAGENLAYGYNTSADTVAGWMASPTHKENLLNGGFTEVGFGVVNASAYNGVASSPSQETIVVAMYASPYVAPAPTAVTKPTTPTPAVKSAPTTTAPTATAAGSPTQATQQSQNASDTAKKDTTTSTATTKESPNTNATVLSDDSSMTNRLQSITGNSLPWLGSFLFVLSLSGGLIVLGKHGFALHNFVVKGERYVLQHTLFDMTIISLIGFTFIASRTVGVIL
jgi:hypothetical protein